MNAETTIEAVSDLAGRFGPDSGAPLFGSLRQLAALEFHASVQLLAERARFLTGAAGVAVALDQDGQFIYCAASGSLVPRIGATADVTRYPLRKCVKTGQAVLLPCDSLSAETSAERSPLSVPLFREEKVAGFFELAPGACAFEDADIEAVARLSAMVSTALDHRDAAEHSEGLIADAKIHCPVESPVHAPDKSQAATPSPILWHAPEPGPSETTPVAEVQAPVPADVHACTACGFPVSGRRTLCLDCEKHQDDPGSDLKLDANPLPEMFATEPHESWISAHGYTIASLLVSALAVAIIYWLR